MVANERFLKVNYKIHIVIDIISTLMVKKRKSRCTNSFDIDNRISPKEFGAVTSNLNIKKKSNKTQTYCFRMKKFRPLRWTTTAHRFFMLCLLLKTLYDSWNNIPYQNFYLLYERGPCLPSLYEMVSEVAAPKELAGASGGLAGWEGMEKENEKMSPFELRD